MEGGLDLGRLHAQISVDDKPFDRGIDRVAMKMVGAQRHTAQVLNEMEDKFAASGEAMGTDLGDGIGQGVQDGAKYAAEGVDGIYRDAGGRLRTAQGKFIKEGTLLGEGVGDAVDKGSRPGLTRFDRNIEAVRDRLNKINKKIGGTRAILAGLARTTAFAGIITGAAGAASAIGPVIALVGTLVVAAGGLAAALPAALLSGVAAAAALKIGLNGVADAIAGDEEALQKLAGPAREFVGVVRDLKPAWDDLVKSVQAQLFEGTAKIFAQTAETILPRLKTGLGLVASGWNAVFRAGMQAATTPRFLAGLDAVLARTGAGLKGLAAGMEGWFRGLGVLLSAVAPMLEDAGEAAGRLGDRFGAWMEEARRTGALQTTLQTMRDTLALLGGIVANLGGIFSSVFGAANESGGGLLGTIEDLTGRLDTFLKSTEGQSALASFFESLSAVGDAVGPIILELAAAVGEDLAPKIADIAEGVGPSFRDLVREIGDAIGKIDAENLAEGFADVLEAITPIIGPVGDLVGGLTSLDGIVPVVAVSLAVFTVAVWALNSALWANPIVWIIGLIIALIAIIVLAILNWDKIVAVFKIGWLMLTEAFEAGKAAISLIWQQIWDWITGKVDQIRAKIALLGTIPTLISDWFGRAKDAAVDKLSSLVTWVKEIPGKVTNALGDLGSLLYNAGKDILQGLLDGIESMWNSVQSKFSELTSAIPDWKGPEAVDRDLLKGPARTIMGGFAEHLQSMFPLIERVMGGLTSDIGLSVDADAAPTAAAAPTIVVAAPPGPETFTAEMTVDLGEGVEQAFDVKLRRQNAQTRRMVLAGTGANA